MCSKKKKNSCFVLFCWTAASLSVYYDEMYSSILIQTEAVGVHYISSPVHTATALYNLHHVGLKLEMFQPRSKIILFQLNLKHLYLHTVRPTCL